jgi:hypothetical protein
MKRLLFVVGAISLIMVVVGVSFASSVAHRVPTGHVGATRLTFFYPRGPEAQCHGDSCGVGGLEGKPFRFDGTGSTYRATISLSFDYTTSVDGSFTIDPEVSGPGGPIDATPVARPLSAQGTTDSTTMVFLVEGLHPGTRYDFGVGANVTDGRKASISTSNLVVTIDASES